MYLTNIYRIGRSGSELLELNRPIFPNIIFFGVVASASAISLALLWENSESGPWFIFLSIALLLAIYGSLYLLVPDKRITLSKKEASFELTGKHWFGKRHNKYAAIGSSTVMRVIASDGSLARNYILEVKTKDGLRVPMGFHGFGSFNQANLSQLGLLLEEKTDGALKFQSEISD